MKSLKDYINEAKLISTKIKLQNNKCYLYYLDKEKLNDINIDYIDGIMNIVDEIDVDTLEKYIDKVEIPSAKWYVYLDKYHGDKPHIATYVDMCGQLLYWPQDFEDFCPNDILFHGETLQDAFEFCADYANLDINSFDDQDEFANKLVEEMDLCDDSWFIASNINNTKKIEEETENQSPKNQTFKSIVELITNGY